ncbi:MAG: LacI family DNA-binding transcriptional regulator [Chloroflexota bacterium]
MATIYDVARAAGVTAATVSVALSGRGVVNRRTRERILDRAQELGYRPNLVARSLTMRRTCTIGLVIYDITNPFYAEAALAVEQTARRAGYRVIFANTTGDTLFGEELIEDLAARQVDGIIAMPGGLRADAVRAIADSGLPIVPCLWDEEPNVGLTPSVGVDFGAGGRLVADHLLDLGHQRIGIVAIGAADEPTVRARETAFRDRLAERGQPLDMSLWHWADSSLAAGHAAARHLLALPHPPTAIFATNDVMALGVLAAARERGRHVPDNLSVVGFDDIDMSRFLTPPLTTVRIEKTDLMAAATDLLLRLIAGEEVTAPPRLVPALVVRGSTAPARLGTMEGR